MAKIVVGVDGSGSAVRAAVWAAGEAVLRRKTLRLVHTYLVPLRGYPGFVATPDEVRNGLRDQGEEWLRQAQEAAQQAVPEVRVETAIGEGDAIDALIQESQESEAVVVGSRGLGGFTGMLVGSVAVALAAHGHCPIIVARGSEPDEAPIVSEGPVVTGVDGSAASDAALGFAFEEAALRQSRLVAVRHWSDTMFARGARGVGLGADPADIDREEHAVLEEQLTSWRPRYPDVVVEPVVSRDKLIQTLLEYSEHAQLLVVGSRGRGGFAGMMLGSTSQALVMHASCPVAVTRGPSVAS